MGGGMMEHMRALMRNSLTLDRSVIFNPEQLLQQLHLHSLDILPAILPFLGLMVVVTVASSVVISGWLFTTKALEPDFSRLNPLKGVARIISWSGMVEMIKAVFKVGLIGGVALWVVWLDVNEVVSLVAEPLDSGLPHVARMVGFTFMAVSGSR